MQFRARLEDYLGQGDKELSVLFTRSFVGVFEGGRKLQQLLF